MEQLKNALGAGILEQNIHRFEASRGAVVQALKEYYNDQSPEALARLKRQMLASNQAAQALLSSVLASPEEALAFQANNLITNLDHLDKSVTAKDTEGAGFFSDTIDSQLTDFIANAKLLAGESGAGRKKEIVDAVGHPLTGRSRPWKPSGLASKSCL
jgi:hypothetical protein